MAGRILVDDGGRKFDANGNPYSGAKRKAFLAGTSTPAALYTTVALNVAHANPMVASSSGEFAQAWAADDTLLDIKDYASDDVTFVTPLRQFLNVTPQGPLNGIIQSGAGAVTRTVQERAKDAVSVLDYVPTEAEREAIRAGTSTTDITAYFQAALDAHDAIWVPDGFYKITAALTPNADQSITLSPGTTIRQYTTNTPIFSATSKANLTFLCNGAVLYGEGAWSAGWSGNGGHYDQAFRLAGCTGFVIDRPHIKNCALAGIVMLGGSGRVVFPIIEGTDAYSTALPPGSNFQEGIFAANDATYGEFNLTVVGPNISGVAQGVLTEQAASVGQGLMNISDAYIHDVTGQHAFYFQSGNVTVSNPVLRDINLSGVKVQASSGSNLELSDFVFTGINAARLGSNMAEITHVSGTGGISNMQLDGVGNDVLVGLALSGEVSRLKADLVLNDMQSAMTTSLDGMNDVEAHIFATGMSAQGIIINSTNTTNMRIHATLRNVNTSAAVGNQYGIIVAQATAAVELFDPDITDTGAHMTHALGATVSGAKIVVRGKAKYRGYTTSPVNAAAGAMISTGGVQTLTGAGAVNLTTAFTELVTTGADALTLADGVEGQTKTIRMKTDGGDGTLTPANLAGGTTITFSAVGQYADLIFTGGEWWVLAGTATLA
jgi:hypothetical protein